MNGSSQMWQFSLRWKIPLLGSILFFVHLAIGKEIPRPSEGLPKEGRIYSLSDCINEALKYNPRILTAQKDLEKGRGVIISAKSTLYPTLSSSLNVQMEDSDLFKQGQDAGSGVHFQDDWIVTLQLIQNVYSGGVNRNRIEIAELQNQTSSLKLEETINDVVFDTRKAFYNVIINQSEIGVRKQTIDLLRKEIERQKSLFEAGRATRFNIIRTEVRLSNELPGLVQTENNLRTSLFQLMEVIGKKRRGQREIESFDVAGSFDCPPVKAEADQLVCEALARSPELTRREKQIEIDKRNLKIAKAALIPRLNLFAATRMRQDETDSNFFSSRNQSTFGVLGTWDLFDGFAGKGAALQSEAEIKKGAIEREATALRIEFAVRKAILDAKQAETSLRSQEGNVQKALEAVRLAKSSVEAGFGTQFDILQATVDLSSAQNIELNARYQYHLALAELERITYSKINQQGKLMEPSRISAGSSQKKTLQPRIPSNLPLRATGSESLK